ncbi:MAG TPA: DNA-binding protein YbiB, partial [Burkholderiaceae bacterium]|nr:DNA-binding protein YbiB [Burkholderiaceae bacterium]
MSELLGYIHEIGRGPRGARDLPAAAAGQLWQAILDGRLAPAAIGAALMAMRLKGESLDELRALREAVHARLPALAPAAGADGPLVCMPCYNGARRLPNLSWLTAVALRR